MASPLRAIPHGWPVANMASAWKSSAPSRVLPGAEPFSFPGGPAGCLLVHGFTSTPYDVRACGAFLAARGVAAEGVLLAGHGTTPEDLAETRLPEWLDSIRAAHARLRARVPHVTALGISLAGNFLVTLAQELSLSGLILVGMPLRFRRERSYRALYYASRAIGKRFQKKWYQQSLDPAIRRARPNYTHIPLACARDAARAVEWSLAVLPAIRCPVLAIQSTTDHAIDDTTLEELRSCLGSREVILRRVPNRYHVVLIDHGCEEVFADIHRFIATRAPRR